MLCAVTGVVTGKQTKIMLKQLYKKAKQFIGNPKRPSDHLDCGSSKPLRRFSAIEPIEMAYVAMSARSWREMIALLR